MWEFWDRPAHGVCGQTWLDRYRYLSSLWLGGGFKHVLFSPFPGEDFQFDLYFSNGLKPPPRWCHVSIVSACNTVFWNPTILWLWAKIVAQESPETRVNDLKRPTVDLFHVEQSRDEFVVLCALVCLVVIFGQKWFTMSRVWLGGGNSNIFYFPPDPWGFMIQFDG